MSRKKCHPSGKAVIPRRLVPIPKEAMITHRNPSSRFRQALCALCPLTEAAAWRKRAWCIKVLEQYATTDEMCGSVRC